jgi:hypothetical protein
MEAYPVPFLFDRSAAPLYRLVNASDERLRGVTAMVLGPGVMPVFLPTAMHPHDAVELRVLGDDLARDTTLLVRWLRANGDEYLWRVSF